MNDPISDWMAMLLEVRNTTTELKAMLTAHLEEHKHLRHNGARELMVVGGGASAGSGMVILGILKLLGVV